jgi:hypothetical protein
MDDPEHLEKFSHHYSSRLQVGSDDLKNLQPQQVDYFLVLDLEGKVEILEFPVVMIDAHSLEFVDAFHRCKSIHLKPSEHLQKFISKLHPPALLIICISIIWVLHTVISFILMAFIIG